MKSPLQILHIEDNVTDAELIKELLSQEGISCNIVRVDSRQEFLDQLVAMNFDLILCDYNLPSFNGTSALELIRKQYPHIPFIFVSGTMGEERAIEAVKLGATDYVLKDRLDRLPSAIERALREVEEIKARQNLEQQLFHAQRMESIGTLAGGIAHDFNNILGIIMGHTTLLERLREQPDKFSASVQTILQAARRGAALVKQLMAFARKHEVSTEMIQVNDSVREAERLLAETVPKTITINLHLNEHLPPITIDATHLQQVLLNLCVNARDAMPTGGLLAITTRLTEGKLLRKKFFEATEKFYVAIDIADTGIGMDEQTQKRIFEPFYTTKEPGKGTGLGLAVVFGIVHTYNGFIDVVSAPGKGTIFSLFFPVRNAVEQREVQRLEGVADVPGGNETILVIEDEDVLRDLLKFTLESKGYTIFTAKDGEEAVEIYQYHYANIALVIGDFQLPKLNGGEVYKRLKKINADIKFILASGYLEPEQRDELINEGVQRIISKPYVPEEMLKIMREVLEQ